MSTELNRALDRGGFNELRTTNMMASRNELDEAIGKYFNPDSGILLLPDLWSFVKDPDLIFRRRGANDVEFRVGDEDIFRVSTTGIVLEGGAVTFEEQSVAPPQPADGAECRMYFKGDKFILRYTEGGTERWKYLDLTGVGVGWTYSASEP
jgi:hypothetical protein